MSCGRGHADRCLSAGPQVEEREDERGIQTPCGGKIHECVTAAGAKAHDAGQADVARVRHYFGHEGVDWEGATVTGRIGAVGERHDTPGRCFGAEVAGETAGAAGQGVRRWAGGLARAKKAYAVLPGHKDLAVEEPGRASEEKRRGKIDRRTVCRRR